MIKLLLCLYLSKTMPIQQNQLQLWVLLTDKWSSDPFDIQGRRLFVWVVCLTVCVVALIRKQGLFSPLILRPSELERLIFFLYHFLHLLMWDEIYSFVFFEICKGFFFFFSQCEMTIFRFIRKKWLKSMVTINSSTLF